MSFSLLEIFSKSLSLMWMLCSSRTGLDDVLSCNAAIVTSESRAIVLNNIVLCRGCCRCVVVKMNPDQLLSHWLLRLIWLEWKMMTPADCLRHLQRPVHKFLPLNSALVMTESTTACIVTTNQDWCRGGVFPTFRNLRCLVYVKL